MKPAMGRLGHRVGAIASCSSQPRATIGSRKWFHLRCSELLRGRLSGPGKEGYFGDGGTLTLRTLGHCVSAASIFLAEPAEPRVAARHPLIVSRSCHTRSVGRRALSFWSSP